MFEQLVSAKACALRQGLKTAVAGAVLALGLSQAAQAAIVFDNGAPDQIYGVNMSGNTVAEDFTLASATTVTGFRFWSIQSSPADYLGSVAFTLFADNGGSPGIVLLNDLASVSATPTGGATGFGYDEYVFDISIAATALAAGTYWLGLTNALASVVVPTEMLWETTAPGNGAMAQYFDSGLGSWFSAEQHLAFNISGTSELTPVPEPGTLALLSLSLVAAGFVRRKA